MDWANRNGGRMRSRKKGLKIWRKVAGAVLSVVLLGSCVGEPLIAAAAMGSLPVTVENEEDDGTIQTGPEAAEEEEPSAGQEEGEKTDPSAGQEEGEETEPSAGVEETDLPSEIVYTLYLTHYFRFTVNGEGRNVSAEEKFSLSEADFEDGVCDLSRFAYDMEPLTVTEAQPLSGEMFDESHEGGARIVYAVKDGWKIAPVEASGEENVLREIFQGQLSDYQFVPANVITVRMSYEYSKTGGLSGIEASPAQMVETMAEKNAGGEYEFELSLPVVEEFRIVLNPDPLNAYLKNPPTGDESLEELQEMLANGDFDGDIEHNKIYYYQQINEAPGNPVQRNDHYQNIYSDEYNQAWNAARIVKVDGEHGYTAAAICGETHAGTDEDHGANVLGNPRLKVTLTESQFVQCTGGVKGNALDA